MSDMDNELYGEALTLGFELLDKPGADILETLYEVYEHYRTRFIEERGLLDAVPGDSLDWAVALADARKLERWVHQIWRQELLSSSTRTIMRKA